MTEVQKIIINLPMGFLTSSQAEQIEALEPLFPVLVRCGAVRFVCGVQYLKRMIGYALGAGDYVRDVSILPAQLDEARREQLIEQQRQEAKFRADLKAQEQGARVPIRFREEECGGAFDGNQVTSDADPGL